MWLHHSNIANPGVRLGGRGLELAPRLLPAPGHDIRSGVVRLAGLGVYVMEASKILEHQNFFPMEILVYSACLGIHSIWKPSSLSGGWLGYRKMHAILCRLRLG